MADVTSESMGKDKRVSSLGKDDEWSTTVTDILSDEDSCPVGVATNRGGKTNQEDTYFIGSRLPSRMTLNGYSATMDGCFGVFDGHGGDRAARYCAEHVFRRIHEEWVKTRNVQDAITAAIRRIENSQRLWVSRMAARSHAPMGVGYSTGVEDGSTCLVSIIRNRVLYVGNVGDSRAIVVTRSGKCVPMSIDQKPNRKDERTRLEAKGAQVTGPPTVFSQMWGLNRVLDVPRVNGALAMSRSIGDYSLKTWISCDPEIATHELSNEDKFLILATDGLWDVISSKSAAKLAAKYSDPKQAADALLKYALDKKTADNVTVLVTDLSAYQR